MTRIIEPSRVFREPIILLDASIGAYFQPPFDLDPLAKHELLKTALRQMERNPELYRAMILDRNRRFATRIEGLLTEKRDYLVIIGTGHLVGRDSVLWMLRKDGRRAQ